VRKKKNYHFGLAEDRLYFREKKVFQSLVLYQFRGLPKFWILLYKIDSSQSGTIPGLEEDVHLGRAMGTAMELL